MLINKSGLLFDLLFKVFTFLHNLGPNYSISLILYDAFSNLIGSSVLSFFRKLVFISQATALHLPFKIQRKWPSLLTRYGAPLRINHFLPSILWELSIFLYPCFIVIGIYFHIHLLHWDWSQKWFLIVLKSTVSSSVAGTERALHKSSRKTLPNEERLQSSYEQEKLFRSRWRWVSIFMSCCEERVRLVLTRNETWKKGGETPTREHAVFSTGPLSHQCISHQHAGFISASSSTLQYRNSSSNLSPGTQPGFL